MGQFLFATGLSQKLADSVASAAGWQLGKCLIDRYQDGEIRLQVQEVVKGQDIYVLGSTPPPAENWLELFILLDTLRLEGAASITAIVPYFGYAKSDHQGDPGDPISARLLAKFLAQAGAQKAVALNLHSVNVEGFFEIPLIHISAMPLMAEHFKTLNLPDVVVASPDKGGMARAKEFATALGTDKLVYAQKYRPAPDQAQITQVEGDVKDKTVIIVDDMVQTGGTLLSAADAFRERGAKEIYIAVTHFIYSAKALPKLSSVDYIKQIVTTDTVSFEGETTPEKLIVLSVKDLLSSHLP